MKLYDAHIIFRDDKYEPMEIRGFRNTETIKVFIKFIWPVEEDGFMKTLVIHMDDIHEIATKTHTE